MATYKDMGDMPQDSGKCILRTGDSSPVLKIFTDDEASENYQREAFVTLLLTQQDFDQVAHTASSIVSESANPYFSVGQIDKSTKCWKTFLEQKLQTVPSVQIGYIDGMTLGKALSGGLQFPDDTTRKIAFQLVYITGQLHARFGVQHNDIYEENIYLTMVTKETRRTYLINDDVFEVHLKPAQYEVTLIDFGSAVISDSETYPTDANVWRTRSDVALQRNNPPEELFVATEKKKKKRSEADAFMIGHVILSMFANGHRVCESDQKEFWYGTSKCGVHAAYIKSNYRVTGVKAGAITKIGLSDEDPFFKSIFGAAPTPAVANEANTLLVFNLMSLDMSLNAREKVLTNLAHWSSDVTAFAESINSNKAALDTAKTRYLPLIDVLNKFPHATSLLRRLMHFDPDVRRSFNVPGTKYCLTAALFHPFFAEFYKGVSTSGRADALHPFAQPLQYNDTHPDVKTVATKTLTKAELGFQSELVTIFLNTHPDDTVAEALKAFRKKPTEAELIAVLNKRTVKRQEISKFLTPPKTKRISVDVVAKLIWHSWENLTGVAQSTGAQRKADEEAKRKQQEAKREEEDKRKEDAERRAREEVDLKTKEDAKRRAIEYAQRKADEEARRKQEEDERKKEEALRKQGDVTKDAYRSIPPELKSFLKDALAMLKTPTQKGFQKVYADPNPAVINAQHRIAEYAESVSANALLSLPTVVDLKLREKTLDVTYTTPKQFVTRLIDLIGIIKAASAIPPVSSNDALQKIYGDFDSAWKATVQASWFRQDSNSLRTFVEAALADGAVAPKDKEEEEAQRQKAEEEKEALRKQEEEEARRQKAEEEKEALRKQEEEAQRQKAEEKEALRKQEEEEARRQKAEEEKEALRKQEEEESQRQKEADAPGKRDDHGASRALIPEPIKDFLRNAQRMLEKARSSNVLAVSSEPAKTVADAQKAIIKYVNDMGAGDILSINAVRDLGLDEPELNVNITNPNSGAIILDKLFTRLVDLIGIIYAASQVNPIVNEDDFKKVYGTFADVHTSGTAVSEWFNQPNNKLRGFVESVLASGAVSPKDKEEESSAREDDVLPLPASPDATDSSASDDADEIEARLLTALKNELRTFVELFEGLKSVSDTVPDTTLQAVAASMGKVASIVNVDMTASMRKEALAKWSPDKFPGYGWTQVKNAYVPFENIVHKKNTKYGNQTPAYTTKNAPAFYKTMHAHALFIGALCDALAGTKRTYKGVAMDIDAPANESTNALIVRAYRLVQTNYGLIKLVRPPANTSTPAANTRSRRATAKAAISGIQSVLEVVESADRYKAEDGTGYNVHRVREELVNPVIEYMDRKKGDGRYDGIQHIFRSLMLESMPPDSAMLPVKNKPLETKYLHALSIAAGLLVDPNNPELIERFCTEWPEDLVNSPSSSIQIKRGSVYDV